MGISHGILIQRYPTSQCNLHPSVSHHQHYCKLSCFLYHTHIPGTHSRSPSIMIDHSMITTYHPSLPHLESSTLLRSILTLFLSHLLHQILIAHSSHRISSTFWDISLLRSCLARSRLERRCGMYLVYRTLFQVQAKVLRSM